MCKIFTVLKTDHKRLCELEKTLTQLNISNNSDYVKITTEYTILKKKLTDYLSYKKIIKDINDIEVLIDDNKHDKDLYNLALLELESLKEKKDAYEIIIKEQFRIKKDQNINQDSIFLELRSASGGNESAIFVEDLVKMYIAYINNKKWQYKIINYTKGNILGYKDIIIKINGLNVLQHLTYEAGIHRVQRIPITDAHGKIQTSTCTIAILPEIKELENIDLNPNDIRIDTFRSSGAGGQHVNVTDSAVRITHIPTNIVVESQNERSQHKNKATAIEVLKIKILHKKKSESKNLLDDQRKNMVGTGDRSEKIRTYNFIKNRVTDHRGNVTIYRLKDILDGQLDLIINKLTQK